ncbi:MAG: hypothetical protein K6A82_06375 [Prevotella sp.]|nr:hypothetical protein [Prevotella sp.]
MIRYIFDILGLALVIYLVYSFASGIYTLIKEAKEMDGKMLLFNITIKIVMAAGVIYFLLRSSTKSALSDLLSLF